MATAVKKKTKTKKVVNALEFVLDDLQERSDCLRAVADRGMRVDYGDMFNFELDGLDIDIKALRGILDGGDSDV